LFARADPQVLFGPYDERPAASNKPKYCSWDAANTKNCNHHKYPHGLISLVHQAGAEIYPSIGGWTLSKTFPAMAASATARTNFANQCVDMIQDYGFDGIDIDWEYPGYAEHNGTSRDKLHFSLLLEEVQSKLAALTRVTGQTYGLTAALPCGPSHLTNINVPRVARALTELNLMSYDFHGAWDATTGLYCSRETLVSIM
jgi:chitinase